MGEVRTENGCQTYKHEKNTPNTDPCSECKNGGGNDDMWEACFHLEPVEPETSTERKARVLREICDEEIETFIRKNTDYGDSFANLRRTLPNGVLVRLYDKWSRLATLMESGKAAQVAESIDDTLMDLANYANMELLERRMERVSNNG